VLANWALFWTRALREVLSFLPGHVVATALLLVAGLAEMCVTPAEPLRNIAAKLAFEFNELGSVFLAALDAASDRLGRTLSANQLFLFEVCVVLVGLIAVLHASKVGDVALEAHVVGQLTHSVILQLSEEPVILIL